MCRTLGFPSVAATALAAQPLDKFCRVHWPDSCSDFPKLSMKAKSESAFTRRTPRILFRSRRHTDLMRPDERWRYNSDRPMPETAQASGIRNHCGRNGSHFPTLCSGGFVSILARGKQHCLYAYVSPISIKTKQQIRPILGLSPLVCRVRKTANWLVQPAWREPGISAARRKASKMTLSRNSVHVNVNNGGFWWICYAELLCFWRGLS
jgi:hypothetical protein